MKYISLITVLLFYLTTPVSAQEPVDEPLDEAAEIVTNETIDEELLDEAALEEDSLEAEIEALKQEVLSQNQDLFILEENHLFPPNTQFSVFLSMDAGALFSLDSAQLKINDKNIANHWLTERELAALKRGGVQRWYI